MSAADTATGAELVPVVAATEPPNIADMTDRQIIEATLMNSRQTLAIAQATALRVDEFTAQAQAMMAGGMGGILGKIMGGK